jgi:hypothetical protein
MRNSKRWQDVMRARMLPANLQGFSAGITMPRLRDGVRPLFHSAKKSATRRPGIDGFLDGLTEFVQRRVF